MRIAVFGANGRIGGGIVREALQRGHEGTAGVRSADSMSSADPLLRVVEADIADADSVQRTVRGHDAVVSAVGGLGHDNPRIVIESAPALVDGMRAAGARRLLVVGTAGTLEVEPGV